MNWLVELGSGTDCKNWWLELGPVDLSAELITIQRQDHLVAAMTRREDGRLRVAVYRPLDAGSASSLNALGLNPRPEGGVATGDNNWEYALDASASSFRQMMAADAGQRRRSRRASELGTRLGQREPGADALRL